jgi:hypothetical protein
MRFTKKAVGAGVEDVGLAPIRADKEDTSGIIHKAMFDHLLLCDFAGPDLTLSNPNVFYELGVRHATSTTPHSPFSLTEPSCRSTSRCSAPSLTVGGETTVWAKRERDTLRKDLAERLTTLRKLARQGDAVDSPVFQLVSKSQQSNLPPDDLLRRIPETASALFCPDAKGEEKSKRAVPARMRVPKRGTGAEQPVVGTKVR